MNPCRPGIWAYGLDIEGGPPGELTNSGSIMPYLNVTIGSTVAPITLSINSQYATAINSLTWMGKQYVNIFDHGRLIQSDAQYFDSNPENYDSECNNPTEAGSYQDSISPGLCSSSQIVSFSATGNQLQSECNMAYYCAPYQTTGNCLTGAINTTVLSGTILTKTVTIGISTSLPIRNQENIIQLDLKFHVSSDQTHLGFVTFEPIAAYIQGDTNDFTVLALYDCVSQTYTEITTYIDGLQLSQIPIIVSTADGQYAIGIYTTLVDPSSNAVYGFGGTITYSNHLYRYLKLSFNQPLYNITNYVTPPYSFPDFEMTGYLVVGALADVINTLQDLNTYMPPAPIF